MNQKELLKQLFDPYFPENNDEKTDPENMEKILEIIERIILEAFERKIKYIVIVYALTYILEELENERLGGKSLLKLEFPVEKYGRIPFEKAYNNQIKND